METDIKHSKILLRNSEGKRSVTVTFAWVSFIATTLAYVASIVESIGPVTFRQFDVAACGSFFGTIMLAYLGRRWTSAKYSPNVSQEKPEIVE